MTIRAYVYDLRAFLQWRQQGAPEVRLDRLSTCGCQAPTERNPRTSAGQLGDRAVAGIRR